MKDTVTSHYRTGEIFFITEVVNGKEHGIEKGYYRTGELCWIVAYRDGEPHGIEIGYDIVGAENYRSYYLYGNKATKEEYRKHELTEELAKL